jgi:hypothetical protein
MMPASELVADAAIDLAADLAADPVAEPLRQPGGEPSVRLYEAILHLRRLGHHIYRHAGDRCHHVMDGVMISDAALVEAALTGFRRRSRRRDLS